jgi:hypothetical protein
MKPLRFSQVAALLVAVMAVTVFASAAKADTNGNSAQLLVTVEPSKNATSAELKSGDVVVRQGHDKVPVTSLTPLKGQPMELYVAIDQATGPEFGTKIGDVTNFIKSLPSNVAVGVVYLQDGGVSIRQAPTRDHAAAAKKVGLTAPGYGVSPFESIVELLKQWPQDGTRHEIVLISPGIEPFGTTTTFDNQFVDKAIAAAQRAEVPVFTIYAPARGHWGHTFWRETWGENYLSQLADETGGEEYNITNLNPTSYASYLNDVKEDLQHQYRVAFNPEQKSNAGFVTVRATTEVPHLSLLTQNRVWVR